MKKKPSLVIIDPGHGGKDPGAIGLANTAHAIRESDAAIILSSKLSDELEKLEILSILTRCFDEYVPLQRRTRIANAIGAPAFVSIHMNASSAAQASGFEVLHYKPSGSGRSLAKAIIESVASGVPELKNRGVKPRDNLYVLRATNMPAVIVECGFITNDGDRELVLDPDGSDRLAFSIAEGIKGWLEKWR